MQLAMKTEKGAISANVKESLEVFTFEATTCSSLQRLQTVRDEDGPPLPLDQQLRGIQQLQA